MKILIQIEKNTKAPVYLQISQAIIQQIRNGILPAGAKLPGSRALADELGVHRKTVIAAYDELLAQGWTEILASKGTFVSNKLPEIRVTALGEIEKPPTFATTPGYTFQMPEILQRPIMKGSKLLTFDDGFPDLRLAPWEAFSRAFRNVVRSGFRKNLLSYADTTGELSLRMALAQHLRETRGLPVAPENVLITRGSTMGIYLAARTILSPGDHIVVGDISYGSGNLIFQSTGAQLHTVPVDSKGLDMDAIESLCQKEKIRMVYVTPHHHYPTTASMPADRRLRLLQLAQEYHFCVLEDDYDYDFHYDSNPVLPLAGADTFGNVVYVGSLCKAFAPALRIGYVVAPEAVINGLAQYRRIIDRQGDNLTEAAVAQLFREGEMNRHLKKAQKAYHQRRDIFCEMLRDAANDRISFEKPTGGMAVWAKFEPNTPLPALAARLAQNGLVISDGKSYSPTLNAARIGFASVNEMEIEKGISILKDTLKTVKFGDG